MTDLFFYLFIVYLMMLLRAATICQRMIGLSMNEDLKRMLKQTAVA
jgi:hypothetical protein